MADFTLMPGPDLPPEATSFVGRVAELDLIGDALTGGRVLTLVGPGGCGKTRLAARACREQAGRWSDGVVWVALDRETDPGEVVRHVARAVELVQPEGPDPDAALAAGLRERRMVLALDNSEHLLDAVARTASAVAARCPGVAVLATSRSRLGVDGERVVRVPPLELADALELFLDRAGALATLGPDSRAAARRVCDRLDRLPLALELAAGWAATLSPAQIADSLTDPYPMLEGGARTAPFRQQTLAESMRWSHDLLDDDQRLLFRRLGVFEPGFTADAVLGLAELPGPPPHRLLAALRGLVDTSLVVADTTGPVARYRMLDVIRAYALARLEEAGETELVRDRHLDLRLAAADELAPLLETDRDRWRAAVAADYPDVRAAVEWGLSRPDPTRGRRLAAATAWLWHLEGRGAEGLRLLRRAAELGAGERTPLQAEVLVALALVTDTAAHGEDGFAAARAARDLATEVGPAAAGRLARQLAAIGELTVDLDNARAEAQRARDDAVAAGDGFVAGHSAALLGLVALVGDRYREVAEHLEPALDGLLSRGDRGVGSSALAWLALAAARTGELTRAGELAERALRTAEPLRNLNRLGTAAAVLAQVRCLQGRQQDAATALAPIDRLIEAADRVPYVPGWEPAHALLALELGDAADAARWCRLEGRWRPEPADELLQPDTRLLLVAALIRAGDGDAAAVLRTLAGSHLPAAMPRVRVAVLQLQAAVAEPERAVDLLHEALRECAAHDMVLGCIDSLEALADAERQRGAAETAATLLGAAARAREETGYAARSTLAGLPAPRHEVQDGSAAVERGRSMDLAAAIEWAARARGPRRRPEFGWDALTPTERTVVELAVRGLSNPEIAARLFVSRGTVKTHLAHIYAKLQVANRTELARLAGEQG